MSDEELDEKLSESIRAWQAAVREGTEAEEADAEEAALGLIWKYRARYGRDHALHRR